MMLSQHVSTLSRLSMRQRVHSVAAHIYPGPDSDLTSSLSIQVTQTLVILM